MNSPAIEDYLAIAGLFNDENWTSVWGNWGTEVTNKVSVGNK